MAEVLFHKESEFRPDSLIVSTKIGLITKGAKLAPQQGILKRGSLIGKAADSLYYLTGTKVSDIPTGVTGVLTDDTDTGEATATDPVVTTQYITGDFNRDALYVHETVNLEDYEDELRKLGIFMQNTIN